MKKVARNDPCPCGSGKKFKQCCLHRDEALAISKRAATASIPKALQEAIEHHQAGRLPQAEALYQQILQIEPDHPDALHFLGVLAHQVGKNEIAVDLIGKAINVNQSIPSYYNNLGTALQAQGKLDAAAESYSQALLLNPDYVEAHNNLGTALQKQGRLDEAIERYGKVLSIKPDYAEAHSHLGVALQDQGKPDAAVRHLHQALSLKPDYAEAHNNLGTVLYKQGRLDEAVACYRKALLLRPDYAEAHNNLGTALKDQGKPSEAVEHYLNALSIMPDYVEAHSNLGSALQDLGRLDEAVEHYLKALTLKPDYAEAHNNLGNALNDQSKLNVAVEHYLKALSIKPDYADARSNLLFLYAYHALLDPHEYLALARGWEQACLPAPDRQAANHKIFQRPPLAGRRLRVGYVSGDYRQHAVSYFIEQLFTHHDRAQIESFAYSASGMRDTVTERLQELAEHWVPLAGLPDAAVRDRIEADDIDVLVDLSGHTRHNRLGVFARRAAPVQAHYLGYFASTGLTEMDYWIGDDILTPPKTDSHFGEQVWRLPRVWVCYDGKADAPVPAWRPSQDDTIWLGSFNNLGKLTPATLALWAKVLHALPEGKLLLKTKELADIGSRQRILDAMATHGILLDRIELHDRNSTPTWSSHMAYYNRLDIALDPVGAVGGGTTTCDALWMGVPAITLEGDRMASRMTASMLDAIGHPEWIARSEAEYSDKVIALARDVELRKTLRFVQRDRMASSPLCDARGLAISLENAYFAVFERWQAKVK